MPINIMSLYPQGTNSTMFTFCCESAICSDELKCPACGKYVIGWDAETDHERGRIRWKNATSHWTH